LIVTNKDEIEIVHEALIREWRQLKEWVDEYREFLIWQERVREDRVFYEERGDLLKDSKLLVAKNFLESHREYISDGDRGFIEESIRRDRQMRNRKIFTTLSIFVVIWGFAFYGFWQKSQSEKLNESIVSVLSKLFQKNVDKKMDKIEIYNLIADEFQSSSKKDITKVIEYYYYIIGINYGKKKKYNKAIKMYQKAIKINPKNDECYYNMGIAYHKNKEYTNAIEAYKKAVGINPNNYTYYLKLFFLQLTEKQPFDSKLEKKYIELFQNEKITFIHYEMLKIFQDITHNKKVNLEPWKKKYYIDFSGWNLNMLHKWIDGIEDEKIRGRLVETLGVLTGHL